MSPGRSSRRLAIEELPSESLEELFVRALKDRNRQEYYVPGRELTWEDQWRYLSHNLAEADAELEIVSDIEDMQSRRQRSRVLAEAWEEMLLFVRAHAVRKLREGVWTGFGRLSRRLVAIHPQDWFGDVDWEMSTLWSPARSYTELRVLSLDLSPEHLRTLRELGIKPNHGEPFAHSEVEQEPRRRGRPSLQYQILELFHEMESSGQLKPTLRSTSQAVRSRLQLDDPQLPIPSLNTIERHLREPFKAAHRV